MKLRSKPRFLRRKEVFFLSKGSFFRKKVFGEYSTFIIKFLLFATVLYLIWIPFASAYFSVILTTTTAYFHLIGISLETNPAPDYLYSQGIRSCIPPFIALVLATPKIKWKKMAFLIGIGISILFLFRVILQISYVYLQITPAPGEFYGIFVIFLSGTCRVALPFLLWFVLTYKQLLARPEPRKYPMRDEGKKGNAYICPFCGAEKIGILDHIKDVHGEDRLEDEKVRDLISEHAELKKAQR